MWSALAPFALPAWAIPILLVVVVAAGASARLGRSFAMSITAGSLAVALPVVLLNGLVFPGARDVLASLGPLAITREGLEFGLPIAGRLVVALAAVSAFVLSTRPDDLMEALSERGVSPRLAFAVLVAVQAIPRLRRQASRIVDGARTRGLRTGGSLRSRAGALGPIAGALAVGALVDVRDRTLALESRGFSSGRQRTAYRELTPGPSDVTATRFALALLVALGAVVAFRVAGLLPG